MNTTEKTTLMAQPRKRSRSSVRPLVVKVGGSALTDVSFLKRMADYVCELRNRTRYVVLVHGGGPHIASLQQRLGLQPRMVDGIRVTDEADLEAVTMALAGKTNKEIVVRLREAGLPAVGISGIDGGVLSSALDDARFGRVGSRPVVNTKLLDVILENDMIPVVAPVSLGDDGAPINVNADLAAAAVASGLDAGTLEYVGRVDGVLMNGNVLDTLDESGIASLSARGQITEGMIPKLQGALSALAGGVDRVRIGSLRTLRDDVATVVHEPRFGAPAGIS